jgi:hypothetical protein
VPVASTVDDVALDDSQDEEEDVDLQEQDEEEDVNSQEQDEEQEDVDSQEEDVLKEEEVGGTLGDVKVAAVDNMQVDTVAAEEEESQDNSQKEGVDLQEEGDNKSQEEEDDKDNAQEEEIEETLEGVPVAMVDDEESLEGVPLATVDDVQADPEAAELEESPDDSQKEEDVDSQEEEDNNSQEEDDDDDYQLSSDSVLDDVGKEASKNASKPGTKFRPFTNGLDLDTVTQNFRFIVEREKEKEFSNWTPSPAFLGIIYQWSGKPKFHYYNDIYNCTEVCAMELGYTISDYIRLRGGIFSRPAKCSVLNSF